jgi:hypothetical protein
MPGRVVGLGAEHGTRLVHALEHADHRLLVELGALGQERGAPEVVELEHVRAALGRRCDDLGCLDLGEPELIQRGAKARDGRGRELEGGATARVSQRERGKVELRGQRGSQRRSPQLERRRLGRGGQHLDLRVVKLRSTRSLVARHNFPGHDDHALRGQVRLPVSGENDLTETAAVPHDQERDLAELPSAVKPAHDRDALADVFDELSDQYPPLHAGTSGAEPPSWCGREASPWCHRTSPEGLVSPVTWADGGAYWAERTVVPRGSGGSFTGTEGRLRSCRRLSWLRRSRYSSPSAPLGKTVAASGDLVEP